MSAQRVETEDRQRRFVLLLLFELHVAGKPLDTLPRVEVVGVERGGLLVVGQCVLVFVHRGIEVAPQVVHLGRQRLDRKSVV